MDVVGLVSSILALASAVDTSLGLAKDFYNAPRELSALQIQLDDFRLTLKEISTLRILYSPEASLPKLLTRGANILQELQSTVDTRLNQSKGMGRGQLAWLWNRSRLVGLKEGLRDVRSNLLIVITTSAVNSTTQLEKQVKFVQAISLESQRTTSRIEDRTNRNTALNALAESIGNIGLSVLARSIEGIPQDPNSRHLQLSSRETDVCYDQLQAYSTNEFPISTKSRAKSSKYELCSRHDTDQVLNFVQKVGSEEEEKAEDNSQEIFHDCLTMFGNDTNEAISKDLEIVSQSPSSAFELMPSFLPERYAPKVFNSLDVLSLQHHTEGNRSILKYGMLYLESPRRWRKVTVVLSLNDSSASNLLPITPHRPLINIFCPLLPRSIYQQLTSFMPKVALFKGVTKLETELHMKVNNSGFMFDPAKVTIEEDKHEMMLSKSKNYLMVAEDMGCPQVSEEEIVTVLLCGKNTYIVMVGSMMCIEIMVPFNSQPTAQVNDSEDRFLWTMKLFYMLRKSSGFAPFVGVVVDANRRELKGYILKLGEHGPLSEVFLDATQYSICIPWARREKWARQIVEAVSDLHAFGFAGGNIFDDIYIDKNDDVKFFGTRKTVKSMYEGFPTYINPPEYDNQKQAHSSLGTGFVTWDTRADLFLLGRILWLLAAHQSPQAHDRNTSRAGNWNAIRENTFDELDSKNPISLPWFTSEVPSYYRNIVAACRSRDPGDRIPALQLLKMFPPQSAAAEVSGLSCAPRIGIIDTMYSYLPNCYCDRCGSEVLIMRYHCYVCSDGNYDLCQACLNEGYHCLDEAHTLEERIRERRPLAED